MSKECQELFDLCFEYLDHELEPAKLALVLAQLEERKCCQHCHETFRVTIELIRNLPSPELPPELKDRLKSCLRKA